MGRIFGYILIALAAFMFIGYLNADVSGTAGIAALFITVFLPAAAGIVLIRRATPGGSKLDQRREELRRDTLQSEMLRLAAQHQGRITIVEAVAALGVTPEEAKDALDALALRDMAEHTVTESGTIVYLFRDVQRIDEK